MAYMDRGGAAVKAGGSDRLNAMEKATRYQGTPLSDDEIRRIASYQQSFNEMARGERFVQDVLQGKARTRERWIVGVPGTHIALLGLRWLRRRHLKYRVPGRNIDGVASPRRLAASGSLRE